ncbi:MAG: hypothetical protein ACK6D3_13575 [Planctomycetaceae bacterium]
MPCHSEGANNNRTSLPERGSELFCLSNLSDRVESMEFDPSTLPPEEAATQHCQGAAIRNSAQTPQSPQPGAVDRGDAVRFVLFG